MNRINWQEGQYGRGIVDQDGHVHAWNDDDYETHGDYLADHPDREGHAFFYVYPDGAVALTNPHPAYDGREAHDIMQRHIVDAHEPFYPVKRSPGGWEF